MKTGSTYLYLFLFLLIAGPAYGQQATRHEWMGRPFNTQTYVDEASFSSNENWSIVQHSNGLIYVANQGGVLEFDGHTWRRLNLDAVNTAFSLAIDTNDVIYVGARGDFGYLAPDSTGTLQFVSLLEYVPENNRDFLNVWGTHVTSNGVYFQSWNYIFRWDGKRITAWPSKQRLHTSFSVYDRFFVKKDSVGLLELTGDDLQLVPGGERFAEARVFMMESFQDGSILIGSQHGMNGPLELFKYSESGFNALNPDPHLMNKEESYTFYHGTRLRENHFALATIYDGVYVIDDEGRMVETLGEDRLIPGDITSVFRDRQGGLWMTHYTSGITHVGAPFSLSEYPSPGGMITEILRFKDDLHVATAGGLYSLKDRRDVDPEDPLSGFKSIEVDPDTRLRWSLMEYNEQLYVSTEMGVFGLQADSAKQIAFDKLNKPKSFLPSKRFEDRIYVGLENGLGIMSYADGEWESEEIGSLKKLVTSMAEAPDGALWVSTQGASMKVWKLEFDEDGLLRAEEEIADISEFEADALEVGLFGDRVGIIAPPSGVYLYDESASGKDRFYLDNSLSGKTSDADSMLALLPIDENNYWTLHPNRFTENTITSDGRVVRESPGVLSIPEWRNIEEVYRDNNGTLWIGDNNQLLRFQPELNHLDESDVRFSPVIRSVSVAWTDSTLFGGGASSADAVLELGPEDNDLRFEYALPDFQKAGSIDYQYRLAGHEKVWSPWSEENHVTIRNIKPGTYTFHVRSRAGGEVLVEEASIGFHISPPWFASWWMNSVYVCLVLIGAWVVIRYAVARKRLAQLEQERAYYDRLNQANEQLRSANASLEEANKMKDEFLANASHELRTPLTAILGFTSVLKEELTDEHHEFVGLIDENGKRLLQTINSLLDLAKLRAGMVQLRMRSVEINEKAEEVAELLIQLAKNRNLNLEVKKTPYQVYAMLDEHNFERVLYNLIGNAIKFTPSGSVFVKVEEGNGVVRVHVQDTGIGIDEKFIPYLFDEFKQEPSVEMRADGSGLGLAISAKLVDLMNGTIEVNSKKGEGSTFTVSFPLERTKSVQGKADPSRNSTPSSQSAVR